MNFNITKIIIYTGYCGDKVILVTDILSPNSKFTKMSIPVKKGTGEAFVKERFPNVPYEVINVVAPES